MKKWTAASKMRKRLPIIVASIACFGIAMALGGTVWAWTLMVIGMWSVLVWQLVTR